MLDWTPGFQSSILKFAPDACDNAIQLLFQATLCERNLIFMVVQIFIGLYACSPDVLRASKLRNPHFAVWSLLWCCFILRAVNVGRKLGRNSISRSIWPAINLFAAEYFKRPQEEKKQSLLLAPIYGGNSAGRITRRASTLMKLCLLLQLTFDSFTLGRFTSWTQAGCPDGDLQISESPLERPQVGGRWCGTAWGPPAIYYR